MGFDFQVLSSESRQQLSMPDSHKVLPSFVYYNNRFSCLFKYLHSNRWHRSKMKELSVKNRKCSSVRPLVSFICILWTMIISCSASSTTEDTLSSSTTTQPESEDLYCSQESCQELRERVESLEEAFRAFVSALSNDEANRHFSTVSRKMSKNRAVQSILSASASTNIIQEDETVSTETPSQSKPRNYILVLNFYLGLLYGLLI